MLNSRFKTFDSKQKAQKAQKDIKLVFQNNNLKMLEKSV